MIRLAFYSQDVKLRHLLAPTLGAEFEVVVESKQDRVKQLLSEKRCDILVLDFDSNHGSTEQQLGFYDEIRDTDVPIVVMTDDERRFTAMELVHRGVYDYFRKPPCLPELKIIVRRAHADAVLKNQMESARKLSLATEQRISNGCDQLIGSGASSRAVYDLIHKVKNLSSFVLITGESGTGKELIARALHNMGGRAKLPFVAVSSGAIPETLIESELFGHEKGAFTGATGTRAGYMEQAGAGTLFLDEIGELSLHTQVKLLRALQQREFMRLGSSRPIPLRARVLFATHRDLAKMVEEGSFRQDLYYRVNVMSIHSPALRDRIEDIPDLAQHMLQQYSSMYCQPMRGIDPAAMAALMEYSWPGNVRELENVIQRAIILSEGDSVRLEDLPETMSQVDLLCLDEPAPAGSFEEQLREYRVKLAINAVQDANGNKTVAARSLNISRAYLHRLIRESGEDVAVI